jgi:nucleotide-binding universal stress UspA family protein
VNKILIATDGSAASAEALEFGLELARDEDAAVVFVHVAPATDVVPTYGFITGSVPHPLSEADCAPLEEAEQAAERAGVRATSKLLVGEIVDEIMAFADSQDVDMIVVGSRGHGAIASALLGSVSRGLLRGSERPVLVVRGLATVATPADAG